MFFKIKYLLLGYRKMALLLFAILSLATACKKVDVNFGEGNIQDPNVVFVDTLSYTLSTFQIDSFPTSGNGVMMIGKHIDPAIDTMTAETYFQLGTPGIDKIVNPTIAVLDSARFLLTPNGSYYGDTTAPITFQIDTLQVKPELQNGNYTFYNTTSFLNAASGLPTYTLPGISPNSKTKVRIPLPISTGSLALDLFTKLQNNATEITDNDQFLAYKQGFKIRATSASAVYSFSMADTGTTIRLYYHYSNPLPESAYVDFTIANSNLQFNHIDLGRIGALKNFTKNTLQNLPSTSTGNKAYIQTAGGLQLQINFPTLRSLRQEKKYQKILKAVLYIKPFGYVNKGIYQLPAPIQLETVDAGNTVIGNVFDVANNQPQSLPPQIDDVYGIDTYYSYDITKYITNILASTTENYSGLFLSTPASLSNYSVDRLILSNNSLFKSVQVKLYTLTF